MSKASDKSEDQAQPAAAGREERDGVGAPQQPDPQSGAPRRETEIDDSTATTSYANFCRVTGTPEELIIDFGLNPQPMGVPMRPIVINQRIILNHYTTKRLLAALQMSVQRHEGVFGVLETDVRKRVQPSARTATESRG